MTSPTKEAWMLACDIMVGVRSHKIGPNSSDECQDEFEATILAPMVALAFDAFANSMKSGAGVASDPSPGGLEPIVTDGHPAPGTVEAVARAIDVSIPARARPYNREIVARAAIAAIPQSDEVQRLREALRACRRATLHGACNPRHNVREIVVEALKGSPDDT